jgi:glucokinase
MTKCYGGIDLGGSYIKAGLILETGDALDSIIVPSNIEAGIPALKTTLRRVGQRLLDLAANHGYTVSGIGIGSPGTIRFPEGLVTGATPNIPGWVGTNISKIFKNFPCPVTADNDANCMGLGEAIFGAGHGRNLGFYLTLGTGVGGAIVLNDTLMRGATYCAGEFGHTLFQYDGIKCKCGRRGCVEAYIAAPALVKEAKKYAAKYPKSLLRAKGMKINPKSIFDAYGKNDKAARLAVESNAAMVGTAIGSIVNLLNPDVVVIGGGLSHAGQEYIDLIRKSVLKFAFESTTSKLKIEKAKFGNEAGWIGAACLNIV